MCDRCIVLHKGKGIYYQAVDDAINGYENLYLDGKNHIHNMDRKIKDFSVEIDKNSISYGDNLIVNCNIDSLENITDLLVQIFVRDTSEHIVAEWTSLDRTSEKLKIFPGMQKIRIELKNMHLANGSYTITYNIYESNRMQYLISSVNEVSFTITGRAKSVSAYQL